MVNKNDILRTASTKNLIDNFSFYFLIQRPVIFNELEH